ncbi:Helicase/methyltransferase (fragment) [Bartonella clarridgeiae 73]|uniref:Helicase/methyltransferase n=1 Tax=Bartonella clarridgeiae (strain CCUG 45776 / CIP 104772 / 73) TaxID=696125 RepID=E6YIS7_BARC7
MSYFQKSDRKLADIPNPEELYYITEMKFASKNKIKDKSTGFTAAIS